MDKVCREYMNSKTKTCSRRATCRFIHDPNLCFHFWKYGFCKYEDSCRKNHIVVFNSTPTPHSRVKNTECFEPRTDPVDMRIVYDNGVDQCTTKVTSRDVLIAPNLFLDFAPGEIYTLLLKELESCNISEDELLKLWHGNDRIPGTHLIVDDRTLWKDSCPTFNVIVDRISSFFGMDVQATRMNWYKDTSQWKPFHHDAAAVKKDKAETQNFTVAVSFGATREAAFEHAKTKTTISLPQPDGSVYAFSKDTNVIWRHGILQDMPVRDIGRISVICWGYVNDMTMV
jgi:hypothetical protein